jgi:hypothetical protein
MKTTILVLGLLSMCILLPGLNAPASAAVTADGFLPTGQAFGRKL